MQSFSGAPPSFRHHSTPWTRRAAIMRRTDALLFLIAAAAAAQKPDLVPVVSRTAARTIDLPAEIQPYLDVSLTAKVPGYVDRVLVDRGSIVKSGELLVEL